MPAKRSTMFEESRGLFSSEEFDDVDGNAFLLPSKAENGHRHSSVSSSTGTNKGSKWFDVPRFDDMLIGSTEKASRRKRPDSANKEGEVAPKYCICIVMHMT
jgi:hypothetical protein